MLIEQLEAMNVTARRCESPAMLSYLCSVMAPEVVFVSPPQEDVEALRRLEPAPLLVAIQDGIGEPDASYDVALSRPVLDNELREVLRRAPARFARRGAP